MSATLSLSDASPDHAAAGALPRPGVGLLGCGVVGTAVARRLIAGHPGLLHAIAVRDARKSRDVAWTPSARIRSRSSMIRV